MGREKLFDTSMFIINRLSQVSGTFITGSAAILWFKMTNGDSKYLTVDGADCYYLNHRPKSIREEYESIKSRVKDNTLPF